MVKRPPRDEDIELKNKPDGWVACGGGTNHNILTLPNIYTPGKNKGDHDSGERLVKSERLQ